ncbi:TPA: hypothetical protein HA228_04495 [Candidatus Woesearchaeota archaeon]|nr:hypothetical protein [Candidatus Woesearchaeota archaeon]HII65057.1 hypothetical protein [Candidatus Woesearchaeota archaeon]HII65286.1 hypothetical protein [Candidatus Woesearchaeota archaeon]
MAIEEVRESSLPLERTFSLRSLLGARVLSKNGKVIGKVANVNIDRKTMKVQGLVIMCSPLFKRIYIDQRYFERMTPESVVLSIEPSVLLRGKKVITYDGQALGKVRDVVRVDHSNTIRALTVKPLFRGEFSIAIKDIRLIGTSVILRENYHAPASVFWKRKSG